MGRLRKPKPPDVRTGEVVYRVVWKDRIPSIEAGWVIATGKLGQGRACRFPSVEDLMARFFGEASISEAVEIEILRTGRSNTDTLLCHNPNPWRMARTVVKLIRLYRRLQQHGLIKDDPFQDKGRSPT